MSRIAKTFADLAEQGRKALIPYVTAGDPEPGITVGIMHAMANAGADIVELGVPFSDPMADGPVIQRAGERALKHGVGLPHVLEMVRVFRGSNDKTPVVLMGYANPIEAMGVAEFSKLAGAAGVDGVIVVDYPPEECAEFADLLRGHGMDLIFLLAPTTTSARMAAVAQLATGYIYYVSLTGITGASHLDLNDVAVNVRRIRAATGLPVGVGFGIRDGATARAICKFADAAIIGSRLIQELEMAVPGQEQARVAAFVRSVREAMGRKAMSWLQKLLPPKINRTVSGSKKNVPEGLWSKCPACAAVLYAADLEKNANVCPKCTYHNRISARLRLDLLLDPEGRFEIGAEVLPVDSLKFKDSKRYPQRLDEAEKGTGETDAIVVMQGAIRHMPIVVAAFEFHFMGGSMGSVVGERFVRGVHVCLNQNLPFVCYTATGGARMQEGLLSLMQMAKTTAALTQLSARKLPFISVLTDPTMGGVSASFAMIGDVVIAEPRALIGFAGPRVIEQTVREKLPEGFQRAEFLLEKGAIDMIVDRRQMREKIAALVSLLMKLPPAGS